MDDATLNPNTGMWVCPVSKHEWSSRLVAEECCNPAWDDDQFERGRE